jgi:hypothetical protein
MGTFSPAGAKRMDDMPEVKGKVMDLDEYDYAHGRRLVERVSYYLGMRSFDDPGYRAALTLLNRACPESNEEGERK